MTFVVDLQSEKDIEQLRRVAIAQRLQIEQLLKALRTKCAELEKIKGSEGELQQTLDLIAELTRTQEQSTIAPAATDASEKTPRKKRTKFGPTEQPKLPEVEKTYELDEADKMCPSCGGELRPMKDQFEASEMIDVVEVSYRVVKVKQQKYACKCGGCIETAPGPERVTPGGRYSLDFAIKIAIDKYLDHIPLARQERILRRHGLEITTQTLWDQLNVLGRRLESASAALLARALSQPVIGLDQTGWPRLDGKGDKPWQMWCLTAPKIVVHRIRDDKSAKTFGSLMKGFQGVVVCDAAQTHGAGLREEDCQGIVLAGCWAHVYRKFEEAAPDHPEANFAIDSIGKLYEIDARADGDLERSERNTHRNAGGVAADSDGAEGFTAAATEEDADAARRRRDQRAAEGDAIEAGAGRREARRAAHAGLGSRAAGKSAAGPYRRIDRGLRRLHALRRDREFLPRGSRG